MRKVLAENRFDGAKRRTDGHDGATAGHAQSQYPPMVCESAAIYEARSEGSPIFLNLNHRKPRANRFKPAKTSNMES